MGIPTIKQPVRDGYKVFYACYKELFLNFEKSGFLIFKFEINNANSFEVSSLNGKLSCFFLTVRNVPMAEYSFAAIVGNKLCAIFVVRPVFIRDATIIQWYVQSYITFRPVEYYNYSLKLLKDSDSAFTYFKSLVKNRSLKLFSEARYNDDYHLVYVPLNVVEIELVHGRKDYRVPQLEKKRYIHVFSHPLVEKWSKIPPSRQDNYDERTIIKIWAIYCKVKKLTINGAHLVDAGGVVLGSYVDYLVENFFRIVQFLSNSSIGFYCSLAVIDSHDLFIKFAEKAKSMIVMNSNLLFFFGVERDFRAEENNY